MTNKKLNISEDGKDTIIKAQQYWDNVLKREFEKETDRGAAIFATSLFDESLRTLLSTFLVSNSTSKDEIFEGPNAPMATLSSKITMAHRLGLITDKFARDLNLIRKIRNEFAHNIQGCDFGHSSIQSRIQELDKSSETIAKLNVMNGDNEDFDRNPRRTFLMTCSWMLTSIHNKIDKLEPLSAPSKEFGYLESSVVKDFKKFLDEKEKELKKLPPTKAKKS